MSATTPQTSWQARMKRAIGESDPVLGCGTLYRALLRTIRSEWFLIAALVILGFVWNHRPFAHSQTQSSQPKSTTLQPPSPSTAQQQPIPPATPQPPSGQTSLAPTPAASPPLTEELGRIRKEVYDAVINHLLVVLAGWFVGGYVLWKFLLTAADEKVKQHEAEIQKVTEKSQTDTANLIEESQKAVTSEVERAKQALSELGSKVTVEVRSRLDAAGKVWQRKEYAILYTNIAQIFANSVESFDEVVGAAAATDRGVAFEAQRALRDVHLDIGIALLESALSEAAKIPKTDVPPEELPRLTRIQDACSNNLAYSLALRGRSEDRARASELSRSAFLAANQRPTGFRWEDTYWWVRLLYRDDPNQAREELRQLYARAGLPRDWQLRRLKKLESWERRQGEERESGHDRAELPDHAERPKN